MEYFRHAPLFFVLLLLLLLLLPLPLLLLGAAPDSGKPSAIFMFGDSIVDPGNNNNRITEARADFPPYGQDFPGGEATGRFSNGRVPGDLLASKLGIKDLLPPYIGVDLELSDLLTGVAFASGGSGYDPLTSIPSTAISSTGQLELFVDYKEKVKGLVGEEEMERVISEGIYFTVMGANDLANNFFSIPLRRHHYDLPSYVAFLVSSAVNFTMKLNEMGAKRIGFVGIPPIGCCPSQRKHGSRECEPLRNQASELFNSGIAKEMDRLNSERNADGSKFAYVDIYYGLLDIIQHPGFYGFKEVNEGCCGSNVLDAAVFIEYHPACPNAYDYIFWDSFHPTEKAYKIVVDKAFQKNIGDCCQELDRPVDDPPRDRKARPVDDPPRDRKYVGQESPVSAFVPLPPPLPPELCTSWDFFDPIAAAAGGSVTSNNEDRVTLNFSRLKGLRDSREPELVPLGEEQANRSGRKHSELPDDNVVPMQEAKATQRGMSKPSGLADASAEATCSQQGLAKVEEGDLKKELCTATEDPSEFITHRAKDFLSSMKDIEIRFIRAAEAGNEVSRMLETKKIRLDICAKIPGSPGKPTARFVSAFRVCCNRKTLLNQETAQHVSNVVTWKRSVSSLSSSSKSPLTTSMIQEDVGDSNSDFIEQFAMVSGSHSSTLDRLHAWERKLYDEIKASENVRKTYDEKCNLLRHQFAQGLNAQLIDKTRAVVKDLHSRVSVAIQAVDAISKRIEQIRDGELQPQLGELVQGLIRMWKTMLECHHKQFITISLAYHAKSSSSVQQGDHHCQAAMHLRNEIDCFSSTFKIWVTSQKSYVEALNAWLQKCILQPPQDRRRRKRKVSFPPRQALSPPIFVLCTDWFAMMESLPTDELCKSIKDTVHLLRDSLEHQAEQNKPRNQSHSRSESQECGMLENNRQEASGGVAEVEGLQSKFTAVLDRLTKFSEVSLKLYEELKQNYEKAHDAYKTVGSNAHLVYPDFKSAV